MVGELLDLVVAGEQTIDRNGVVDRPDGSGRTPQEEVEMPFQRLLIGSMMILAGASVPSVASASLIAEYAVTSTGVARQDCSFGYTPPGGIYTPLTGDRIIAATLSITYRPAPGEDINSLYIGMDLPVEGSVSQSFVATGDQFAEIAPGLFRYELTTTDFNGLIVPGRFDLITASFVDGGPTSTDGEYFNDSGFYYTVAETSAVPEPASAILCGISGMGAAGAYWRRRRPGRKA